MISNGLSCCDGTNIVSKGLEWIQSLGWFIPIVRIVLIDGLLQWFEYLESIHWLGALY